MNGKIVTLEIGAHVDWGVNMYMHICALVADMSLYALYVFMYLCRHMKSFYKSHLGISSPEITI